MGSTTIQPPSAVNSGAGKGAGGPIGKGGSSSIAGQQQAQVSGEQPEFGKPNQYSGMPSQYANSVGMRRLDTASLYPRQQPAMGGGKGGKMQPSGVGSPGAIASGIGSPGTTTSGVGSPAPLIESPLKNIPINSAGSLYASRGAKGDQDGMSYWQSRYAAGEDPANIQRDFNASFDYVKNQQNAG